MVIGAIMGGIAGGLGGSIIEPIGGTIDRKPTKEP